MSRIGKLPIPIPQKVQVEIKDQMILVTGPHGALSRIISDRISVELEDQQIILRTKEDSRLARQLFGLSRTLVNNMVIGVSQKFERQLELKGVGYRSQVKGKELILNLGFSHPVVIVPPEGIEVKVEANTKITISGIDKEAVGQLAATIRAKRPPEPYKGKGVLYLNEVVNRKVGKSGK